jgi:hypothetical protein
MTYKRVLAIVLIAAITLPANIIEATAAKYREAYKRLTGPSPY